MPISYINNNSLASGVPGTSKLPAGSVLQVQSAIVTDQIVFNVGSSNQTVHYSISGFSVSITPTSSTSRFLLIAQVTTGQYTNAYNAYYTFYRGETKIGAGSQQNSASDTSGASFRSFDNDAYDTLGMSFLDSPNTSSSITYSVRVRNSGGSSYPAYLNRAYVTQPWHSGCSSTLTVLEIAT
jgi:hypothetical protein